MFLKKIFEKKSKKIVIVQCRLSSTRLPRKALMKIGDKTIIECALLSMKKVKADKYFLATDVESAGELEIYAKKCGYKLYAGSKEDVLQRFCDVIELSKCDIVIRATADNPYLFYETAEKLSEKFEEKFLSENIDYMTFTGLPHGSGIEVMNAKSLLKACDETNLAYDHEHVGPALYNHKELFNCVFIPVTRYFDFPNYIGEYRTTVDTDFDYKKAQLIYSVLIKESEEKFPFTANQIIKALENPLVKNTVLLYPSCKKGFGTGHFNRCLKIAVENNFFIYIPDTPEENFEQVENLVSEAKRSGLNEWQIIRNKPELEKFNLVITDLFKTDPKLCNELASKTAVVALDEGNDDLNYAEYVLNIIPSLDEKKESNCTDSSFIPLPENTKALSEKKEIKSVLVTFGGEDPENLTLNTALVFAENEINVTAIIPSEKKYELAQQSITDDLRKYISISNRIENLKEKLYEYDLVVTHFGFTAFEARGAGCEVLLVSVTPYHEKLSVKYNFKCIEKNDITTKKIKALIKHFNLTEENKDTVNEKPLTNIRQRNLSLFLKDLSKSRRLLCPICHNKLNYTDKVIARTEKRTFRRCSKCSLLYMSWSVNEKVSEYTKEYFFEEYKNQYGKTYLEDFVSIKSQGIRRIGIIDMLYRTKFSKVSPTVLDIGCAMGPFMDAANESGWQVFGTDLCEDAVSYVQNELSYPAVCGSFPDVNLNDEFGIDLFDCVTMWYVIEHFSNLDKVLEGVSKIIKKGGIFAFSTPSGSGVSAKYNTKEFFKSSPADHYSIWEYKTCEKILEKYGFKVLVKVSTGIHPERFPKVAKGKVNPKSFKYKFYRMISKIFHLGDTFEVYCKKIN